MAGDSFSCKGMVEPIGEFRENWLTAVPEVYYNNGEIKEFRT